MKAKGDEAKEEHKKCDGAETIEEATPSHVVGLVTAWPESTSLQDGNAASPSEKLENKNS